MFFRISDESEFVLRVNRVQKIIRRDTIHSPRVRAAVEQHAEAALPADAFNRLDRQAFVGKRGTRLDESTPGTGLGLSIVADIATTYRGAMKLDASPHGGLLVRLDLPSA